MFTPELLQLAETVLREARTHGLKIVTAEIAEMNAIVRDVLSAGPLTQQDLIARVRPQASRRMRFWLTNAWSAFRPAIVEGLICYGPPRGSEVTLVRADRWLPPQVAIDETEARRRLARSFLTAYGPADPRDFCRWSGVAMTDAKALWSALAPELRAVSIGGRPSWVLRRDVTSLTTSELDASSVRLLPSFDPLLLAHAQKDHLVRRSQYKRVYRNQGWLSPVVLVGGRIAKSGGKELALELEEKGYDWLTTPAEAGAGAAA